MAEADTGVAGSVVVQIGGSTDPLGAALAKAEAMVRAWDAKIAGSVPAAVSSSLAAVANVGNQATASLAKVAAPAAAAAAQITKVGSQAVTAGAGIKGAAFQTANLAAQLNDIFVSLSSGQSGMMVGIQQGTQINQVIGQQGAAGAVKSLGAAFASLINPVSLSTIGIIALGGVAVQYLTSLSGQSAQAAEQALERQKRLVDDLTAAFPKLGKAMKDALDQSPTGTENQILVTSQRAIEAAQRQMALLTSGLSLQITSGLSGGFGASNALSLFPEIAVQVKALDDQFRAGQITATTFSDKLAGMELNPDLPQLAKAVLDQFVDITNQIAKAQIQADAFASTLEAARAQGGFTIGGDFAQLGGGFSDAMKQFQSVIDSGVSQKDRLTQTFNKNLGGATDLSQIKAFTNAYHQALSILDQRSDNTAAKAFDTLTDSIAKQTEELRSQLGVFGQSIGAIETAKVRTQLLTAAQQDHLALSPALKTSIEAQASSYGALAQKLAETKAMSDAFFATSQFGRTSSEQGIASAMRGLHGDDYAKFMDSPTANVLRFNDALQQSQQLVQSFGSTLINDLSQGKGVVATLADAFGNLGQQLLQMALNQAIASLFSNLLGAGLGSIAGGAAIPSGGFIPGITGPKLFADGGYTGNGGKMQPAGIVHRGEYVFDAASVARIGVRQLDGLRGYASGGLVGAANSNSPAAANGNSTATVRVELGPGLEAKILQQSGQQTVQIIKQQVPQMISSQAPAAVAKSQRNKTL